MKRAAIHFLFALFVLLQVHAPLVHAHVGGDIDGAANHLDIHDAHPHTANEVEMHAADHPTQIVEIARAIKQRGVLIPELVAILIALSFIFVSTQGTHRVASLAPRHRGRDTNYLPSPRAPPSA